MSKLSDIWNSKFTTLFTSSIVKCSQSLLILTVSTSNHERVIQYKSKLVDFKLQLSAVQMEAPVEKVRIVN